jgi:hypothetical protein
VAGDGGGASPLLPPAVQGQLRASPSSSSDATASLVCSLVGLGTMCLCPAVTPVLGIAGVVLGGRANRAARATHGPEGREGLATAGVIIGWVDVALSIGVIALIALLVVAGLATQHNVFVRTICTGSGC